MDDAEPKMIVARCPHCGARIRFRNDPEIGQVTICPECGARLEVVKLAPLTLYWASDEAGENG